MLKKFRILQKHWHTMTETFTLKLVLEQLIQESYGNIPYFVLGSWWNALSTPFNIFKPNVYEAKHQNLPSQSNLDGK